MKLGTVKLVKITAAHDVGRAINPLLVEGQIEGGIAQGIGMALMEEYIPGRTENLHDYLIPTIGDVPPIESILIEVPDPEGPFGAKGLGEHVLIPTAPAILNAIRHATGVLVTKVPATPTRVLAAIKAKGGASMSELSERFETHEAGEKQVAEKIRCDACPVMCYIADGRSGACDRYGNIAGQDRAARTADHTRAARRSGGEAVPFDAGRAGGGELVNTGQRFVTAIGAGTTYPDYKPAPFIVSQEVEGVDLVTVVTEGIFSYCGVKVKIDTDRHLGPEAATVRAEGEAVGHVTTGEYGSQMLSLGGVHHLTGGSKSEGRVTCDTMLNLCNKQAGGADHRRRRDRHRAGRKAAGHRRQAGAPHARRLRLGDDRHVRGAVARAGRRGGRGRRPHHRRGVRAPGRQGARLGGYGDQDHRPALDARPLFQGVGAGARLGRHDDFGPAVDPRRVESEEGRATRHVAADGLHHRRAVRLLRARRGAEAGRKAVPGAAPEIGRADRGKLRAGALHRAVRRRRGRVAAGRRGREPGAADALGAGPANLRHGRRRACLCLAGRRHHADGRRDARARQRLRLRADAGAGGADRIHAAPRRLCRARRPCGGDPDRRGRDGEGRRISQSAPRGGGVARQSLAAVGAAHRWEGRAA